MPWLSSAPLDNSWISLTLRAMPAFEPDGISREPRILTIFRKLRGPFSSGGDHSQDPNRMGDREPRDLLAAVGVQLEEKV